MNAHGIIRFKRSRLTFASAMVLALHGPIEIKLIAAESLETSTPIEADLATRARAPDLASNPVTLSMAEKPFALDRNSDVFEFESGPSYFQTIALPIDSSGKRFGIKSYYGPDADAPKTVLIPALIFLNNGHQIIETFPRPMVEVVNEDPGHLLVSEKIPADAAFAVVYTSQDRAKTLLNFKPFALNRYAPSPRIGTGTPKLSGAFEGTLSVLIEE